MAKRSLADRLDQLIAEMLAAEPRAELAPKDQRLAGMARLAADLRDLPRPGFKEGLKNDLKRGALMSPTAVNPIRAGFHTITPYVTVLQAAEMIDFVKSVFGAQELFRGTGSAGGIHAEVRIGDSMMMIGGGSASRGTPTPSMFQYYVPNVDEVYERAVAAGATVQLALLEDHGDRFGSVTDPFGNHWIISKHLGPKYVPEGLRDVTIYLHPVGAPKLIDFLKQAFAAEEFVRYDSPDGTVLHAKVRIGDSIIEMGDARRPSSSMVLQPMPTAIYLYVPNADAVYRNAIAAGAVSLSEPADQPYGDRLAGVQDFCGNRWYIATHIGSA
ncbi:MAG TPA: VOC family protein [Bryobacteraceae bacterium]|nr:VOC family protein [Bryobacteraceae bacterium]